jgi:hypothetical protein
MAVAHMNAQSILISCTVQNPDANLLSPLD